MSRAALVSCVAAWLALAPALAAAQQPLPAGHPPGATAPPLPPGATAPPGHTSSGAMPPAAPPLPPGAVAPPGHTSSGAMPPSAPPIPAGAIPPPGHAAGANALPAGHPSSNGAASADAAHLQQVLRPPVPPTAEESNEIEAGTIRVLVVDEHGLPAVDQPVNVGSLASGERTRHNERTNDEGIALFTDLPTGSAQHYRVNVPNQGATYSTMPFALPTEHGFSVRVVRLPVTREDNFVFFHMFRIVLEQRGERIHIIHQGELTNAGSETFVFPEEGTRAALPEDAVAFQFQRVITDQRIEEIDGEHMYALRGSLPPGTVSLAWAYDVPVGGGDMSIPFDLPMRFFGLQVVVEALPELEVSVAGMPSAQRLDTQGQPCESSVAALGCAWVTQLRRGPNDSTLDHLAVRLTGIRGPGPVRWVASGLAALFILLGVLWLLVSWRTRSSGDPREARRDALKAEAEALAAEFEAGDIGPEYLARRRAEIVRELAGVHHLETVDADSERSARGPVVRRMGVVGFLGPAELSTLPAQITEIVLTMLSAPLLLLPVVFVALRPRATRSMGGQGETVISLVLGVVGVVVWSVAADALGVSATVAWSVLSLCAVALILRLVVRNVAPPLASRT